MTRVAEALAVENVTVAFGGLVANDDVSLTLAEGEILGLIGPNGAGKSTLFSVLSGFQRPQTGEIRLFGQNIVGMSPEDVCRAGLCRTFQIVRPFARMTVLDNVMIGAFARFQSREGARAAAMEALRQTDLDDFAEREAAVLSVASKKRLELARALATGPRVLLLDEVMAGLTPAEAAGAVRCVQSIHASGVTLVIVEHVMEILMPIVDRVVVMDRGSVIAQGTPAEIAHDPIVLSAYLGAPES